MIYPMNLGLPLDFVDKYYKLNIKILNYRTSNHEQSYRHRIESIKDKIDQQVISFVTEESINVNFFVIDKAGSFIYKNESCNTDIEHNDAKRLPFHVWKNTEYVLQTGKKISKEETSHEGKVYLSVKSPLVINGKVEGVIGLAVDITDRKKKEELENKLKMREELYKIAKEVSHDIASPVTSLKIIEEIYEGKLSEEDKRMLKTAIRSIEDMAGKMLSKYRINKNEEIGRREEVVEKEEEGYINVKESMKDIVENMRYRSKGEGVEIKIEREREKEEGIVYIKGDNTDFRRMMVNVIKNGKEAMEGKKGEIEVGYREKGEEVEIRVKDRGKGMKREMAEKIKRGEEVGTTKKKGYGIGMGQVMGVIREMRGKVEIETKEGEGTEFIFTFPKAEKPA
ncbi:MAG: GHKL domain-containing protein [Endomicrobium sp.]|jgi:signal transduction histidine kinase|nr:GHKL domain-containing protein [Endomicrobium sp.]